MNKFDFLKNYVNFHATRIRCYFYKLNMKLDRSTLSFNALGEKLICTMQTNLNGRKRPYDFETEKSSC